MCFTTVSKCSLHKGTWDYWVRAGEVPPYFHPEDISIILNQPEAIAVQVVSALCGKQQIDSLVLIGVKSIDEGQAQEILADPDHLVALACKPYNHQGGVFLAEPIPPH